MDDWVSNYLDVEIHHKPVSEQRPNLTTTTTNINYLFSGSGRSVRCKVQATGDESCLQEARPPRSHAVRHQHLAHQRRPQVLGAGDQAIRQQQLARYTRGPQDIQLVIRIA